MSLINSLGRTVFATGVASQLGAPNPVSYTPAMIICVITLILMLYVLLSVFGMKDGVDDVDSKGTKTKNVTKGYFTAFGISTFAAVFLSAMVYKISWNISNPAYAAAEMGMNQLFHS
jgi:hypothetical protein